MTENSRPIILAIGGSDSSGLAGVQRDNATVFSLGGHAMNVVSANTAQNARGVLAINTVEGEAFSSQLNAALEHSVQAIKLGLLASSQQVETIAEAFNALPEKPPLIVDPVFAASSGEAFSDNRLIESLITHILPLAEIITPNRDEAERLSGIHIDSYDAMAAAAQAIKSMGAVSVLIKGGHTLGEKFSARYSVDYFLSDDHAFFLRNERVEQTNTRGTGCTLASAIATARACGHRLADAVVIAKMAIQQALRSAYALASQPGPVAVMHFPDEQRDLPERVRAEEITRSFEPFLPPHLPNGDAAPLGLYPVVETADWVARLVKQGVNTIQLRNKTLQGEALLQEIKRAVKIAEQHNTRLFINDYWQLAMECDAYGVHLGQEDLIDVDLEAIRQAGLRLGLSTHCHYEVARAHAIKPSYIACGPVFPTTSKVMPWIPHGVAGFSYWRKVLDYPLVAIGGINLERTPGLVKAGADGIAMISAITQDTEPEKRTQEFIRVIHGGQ